MHRYTTCALLCLLLIATVPDAYAQKRRTAGPTRTERLANIDSLMRGYRFSEAIELIEDEIAVSVKAKLPTDSLEHQLEIAEMGERMVGNTMQVEFVDSFLCSKSAILNYIRPAQGAGTLAIGRDGEPESLSYTNEFGDLTIFSESREQGSVRLVEKVRLGQEWAQSQELEGLEEREARRMVAPFLMSDGTSLYFAEESEEGLGGLDIFVTRMGPMRNYLLPENIGMPFNSPANDYLYVVDEEQGLGWFVSDRGQRGDTVCVYVFLPPTQRLTYADLNDDSLCRLARIASIADARPDEPTLNEARERLRQALQAAHTEGMASNFRFALGDGRVVTEIGQLGTAPAMQAAIEWDNAQRQSQKLEQTILELRLQWHNGNHSEALRKNILSLEAQREALRERIAELANQIREAEL